MDIATKLRSPATVFYEHAVDDGALLKEAADVRGIMAPDGQMNDDADYWMEKTESALKRAGNYQIALAVAEMHIARASGGGETDLRARLQHVINTGEPMPEAGQTTDTSK